MKLINKTRFAILGVLLESPSTGYDIKSLMHRSTSYFWRESDATIYPMLKLLEQEGKISADISYIGKKMKRIYSITKKGEKEFDVWLSNPTGTEIPRNEFLLKLFFATNKSEANRLMKERLKKVEELSSELKVVEKRLEGLGNSTRVQIRLSALKYGLSLLTAERKWLKGEVR